MAGRWWEREREREGRRKGESAGDEEWRAASRRAKGVEVSR